MTAQLIHDDHRHDLRRPDSVALPDGVTRVEAEHLHANAAALHTLATDLAKAGA